MLADTILFIHFAIAAFIVLGLPLVWIGAALGWRWVRNPWFRYLHLAAIVCVAAEALLGVRCPLTVWEDALRGVHESRSFVSRWVTSLLFYRAPEWVFAAVYVLFGLATAVSFKLIPPRRRSATARQRTNIVA